MWVWWGRRISPWGGVVPAGLDLLHGIALDNSPRRVTGENAVTICGLPGVVYAVALVKHPLKDGRCLGVCLELAHCQAVNFLFFGRAQPVQNGVKGFEPALYLAALAILKAADLREFIPCHISRDHLPHFDGYLFPRSIPSFPFRNLPDRLYWLPCLRTYVL